MELMDLREKSGKDYKDILLELQERLLKYDDKGAISKILDFQRNFKQYSFQNCLMILFQYPEATRIAGLKTWNKLGRRVRKGEKGIKIFAPLIKKVAVKTKETNEETNEEEIVKTEVQRLMGFKLVTVFDIAQTEGKKVIEGPSIHSPYSDNEELYHTILQNSPITVTVGKTDQINQEIKGMFLPVENRIVLSDSIKGDNRLLVLLHELGHFFSYHKIENKFKDNPDITRIHEIVAEGATYIFCREYDLDLRPSYQYLYSWTRHGKENILTYGELIRQTANKLIELAEMPAEAKVIA